MSIRGRVAKFSNDLLDRRRFRILSKENSSPKALAFERLGKFTVFEYDAARRLLAQLGKKHPERHAELYREHAFDKAFTSPQKRIVRRRQRGKTGSSTVLLGGKLFGKAIVRGARASGAGFSKYSIDPWVKALGSVDAWKKAGFDYVPIEPILLDRKGNYRIHENKDGTYRVAAGVVKGTSLAVFNGNKSISSESKKEVVSQAETILKTLSSLGIKHGHPHAGNFIVEKINLADGHPSYRIYLIDFDSVCFV